MAAKRLTVEDHKALSAAIRAAERGTAGEIYVVVARQSDDYFHPAALMLTAGALAAGVAAAFVLEDLWISLRVPVFALAQAVALVTAWAAILLAPSLRIHLVPRRLRYRRAHDNAVKQFLARNVHVTAARTGILIFVSLAEKYAEVIADAGIHRHVAPETWTGMVARLTGEAGTGRLGEGLEAAVAEAGAILARHIPPASDNRNELDDHVVEI